MKRGASESSGGGSPGHPPKMQKITAADPAGDVSLIVPELSYFVAFYNDGIVSTIYYGTRVPKCVGVKRVIKV